MFKLQYIHETSYVDFCIYINKFFQYFLNFINEFFTVTTRNFFFFDWLSSVASFLLNIELLDLFKYGAYFSRILMCQNFSLRKMILMTWLNYIQVSDQLNWKVLFQRLLKLGWLTLYCLAYHKPKILISISEGIIQKKSYERCDYESVDEKSLS